MKFYNEKDIREMTDEEFLQMIDEMRDESVKKAKLLSGNTLKAFNTIEEALKYYNAIPLEEWENNMREKYGIN